MDDQANNSNDQQQVNQTTRHVESDKAQKPSYEQHNEQNEKHNHLLLPNSKMDHADGAVTVTCHSRALA